MGGSINKPGVLQAPAWLLSIGVGGGKAGLAAPPALMGSHPGHSIQESTNQPLSPVCMLFP